MMRVSKNVEEKREYFVLCVVFEFLHVHLNAVGAVVLDAPTTDGPDDDARRIVFGDKQVPAPALGGQRLSISKICGSRVATDHVGIPAAIVGDTIVGDLCVGAACAAPIPVLCMHGQWPCDPSQQANHCYDMT